MDLKDARPFSPPIEKFAEVVTRAGGKAFVRVRSIVAAIMGESGAKLFLSSGAMVECAEGTSALGAKGVSFHNSMASTVVNGEQLEGQFSYRTGYLTLIQALDGNSTLLEFEGGHRFEVGLPLSRFDDMLRNATEHEQAAPHNRGY